MARDPASLQPRLPGARTSCALLTLLTVLLAWPNPPSAFALLVRPAYFALLTWFFWRTKAASPALHSQPMRLVCGGFFVLWLGFTLAAFLHFSGLENEYSWAAYLRTTCERGAWFLLGTTLLSYGLMLWIPQVLQSHELLAVHSRRQEGELQRSETARTLLEQRLIEADRLAMLGELAASIAHDLRNPLTIVKGTAESLCRKPRTSDEVAAHTDVIRRNIDKADETIESLIHLAKPKASEPQDLDALAALREVQELLQLEAQRRRVGLTVRPEGPAATAGAATAAAALDIVRGDRTLLAQALMNLVLNALQASPPHSETVLQARRCRNHVAIVVADRGNGLPDEVRSKLFQRFFTTKETGTGLGLISCRRIASELGGQLRLAPRLRGGTRAILWLPLAMPSRTAPPAADRSVEWANTTC